MTTAGHETACAACGRQNRPGARFCSACGKTLDVRCSRCGQSGAAGSRFCDGCGTPLVAPAGPDAPARDLAAYTPHHLAERILKEGRALRGERKEVTVLFVDVQGSTGLASTLDPEEFHEVMDGAFQLMLDAVHRWEGTVNQFTGDGIMALFGAPIAHEDHARRALHAALDIRRRFVDYAATLRAKKGLSLQARLGLNSGPVVVGAIGDDLRMDYTAQGLTAHLAARMQQAADPGTILVAAPTHGLTEGYFRFKTLGNISVRGIADPVEAYVLEAEGSVVSRLEASLRRGASPFRGREAEMVTLAEYWERAAAGRGGAVCLVGEPGIGKSRLVYEFQRSLGMTERVEGAALAHARGAAYFVFRQLLRQLAGVEPESDQSEVRDRLHRRLWDLSPDLTALVPEILTVLGAVAEASTRETPEDRRDRLREAVGRWIGAECRRAPRVLVIEDVHWIDPSSEELLRHLALDAQGLPLMLLLTSRLPLAGTNLELGRFREIQLRALTVEDIHAVVDAQLDPYPASERLRQVTSARSEGNPFFVEELVRAFREGGDLVLDRGVYELQPTAERVVPSSVSALLSSRIDRLPGSARELLADAAVLGTHFPLTHLRVLAGSDRFEEDLATVEKRGFLDRVDQGLVAGLTFRHVLTHEVAYGTLLSSDRQARHSRAARMLEQLYRGRTEEVADALAHHWLQSDSRLKALPHLLAAADRTVAMGANQEAIGHLQTALAVVGENPGAVGTAEIDAIRLKLAGLYFVVGER